MKQSLWSSLAIIVALAIPAPAHAVTAGPALLDVKELVLQNARIGNVNTADACGLSRADLTKAIVLSMKTDGVTIIPVSEAKPPVVGIARVDLIPEIVSLNTQNTDCTSWISLSAQSQNVLTIPPIATPRNIIVTYWRSGLLVSSAKTTHGQILNETAEKIAHAFARQYLVDQPPALPNIDEIN